jgi:hypothetical protein
MKSPESLHRTLAFAATLAALGASVGVCPTPAHAQQPGKNYAPLLENQGPGMQPLNPGQKNRGTVTGKIRAGAGQMKEAPGATQKKYKTGTSQHKIERGGAGGAPGSAVMLNPQPLPPKLGVGGAQSPAVQK